jgi:hypothetical protein
LLKNFVKNLDTYMRLYDFLKFFINLYDKAV